MRPHAAIVIGYHGCDHDLAVELVSGHAKLAANDKTYHWLGRGIYFWENDRQRALEWAQEKAGRGEIKTPTVIGAVLELGGCLDISVRENVPLIAEAHRSLKVLVAASGRSLPVNKPAPKDPRPDKVMRFLDYAVLNHLVESAGNDIDTVRGLFVEGGPIYEGAEIFNKTHVEIAVRNPDCIRGIFFPIP